MSERHTKYDVFTLPITMQEQIIANPKGPTSTANKAKLSPY